MSTLTVPARIACKAMPLILLSQNPSFREKIDIEGVNHPKRMFDLTEGLMRRKYSDKDIEGILGGNFKRVLSQIWTV